MSGAEVALEAAMLAAIRADAGVKSVLGDPARVFDAAVARPAFPFMEIVRQQARPIGGVDAPTWEHTFDLAIRTSVGGREQAKEALIAVRGALEDGEIEMSGFRCLLVVVLLADVVRQSPTLWRALIRVRMIVEPT